MVYLSCISFVFSITSSFSLLNVPLGCQQKAAFARHPSGPRFSAKYSMYMYEYRLPAYHHPPLLFMI